MAKEKKIGIKYYLNDNLKPTIKGDTVLFPLYIRITYNGEVTRIKAIDFFKRPILLDEGNEVDNEVSNLLKDDRNLYLKTYLERNLLEKVIRLEIKLNQSNFTLNGLGDRLKYYSNSLFTRTEFDASSSLESFLGDHLTYNEFISTVLNYDDPIDLFLYSNDRIENFNEIIPNDTKQALITMILTREFDENLTIYDWIMKNKRINFITFLDGFGKRKIDKKSKDVLSKLDFKLSDKHYYLSTIDKKVSSLFMIE